VVGKKMLMGAGDLPFHSIHCTLSAKGRYADCGCHKRFCQMQLAKEHWMVEPVMVEGEKVLLNWVATKFIDGGEQGASSRKKKKKFSGDKLALGTFLSDKLWGRGRGELMRLTIAARW
jgi:hypothetical protein